MGGAPLLKLQFVMIALVSKAFAPFLLAAATNATPGKPKIDAKMSEIDAKMTEIDAKMTDAKMTEIMKIKRNALRRLEMG